MLLLHNGYGDLCLSSSQYPTESNNDKTITIYIYIWIIFITLIIYLALIF